jgi:tetratricopeptide (TPR) repeat protein
MKHGAHGRTQATGLPHCAEVRSETGPFLDPAREQARHLGDPCRAQVRPPLRGVDVTQAAIAAAGWIESLGRADDHADMLAHHYQRALELARAASQDEPALAPRARAALRRAGDRAFALSAFPAAARYYQAALALWPPDAPEQRAGLLGMLGTALYEAGELHQAEAALAEGSQTAAAARLPALQTRIRLRLAEVHLSQGGSFEEVLAEAEAATAILDAEGDPESLAEAWLLTGKIRFWAGDSPADRQDLERVIAYARQTGHRHLQMQASFWLATTFMYLPIPADTAVARAEQLLQAADGEPWAEADVLMPLSLLYAYAGSFGDARGASARARSLYDTSGAKIRRAMAADVAGQVEQIAGDTAAAERHLRESYEAYRAMGERGYLSTVAGRLAEALCAQGRLEEAQQVTEQAQEAAAPDDIDARARWRAVRARLIAGPVSFPPRGSCWTRPTRSSRRPPGRRSRPGYSWPGQRWTASPRRLGRPRLACARRCAYIPTGTRSRSPIRPRPPWPG